MFTLLSLFTLTLSPVQGELLEVREVAGDVLQGGVRDPRAPAQVEADQLPQVLRHQLDAVIRDLAAAGEGEDSEVWQRMN